MVLPWAYLTLTVSPVLAIEEDYEIFWATTFNYNYYSDLWKVYNYHRDVTEHLRANMKLMRRRKRSLEQNTFNMTAGVFAHPNTIIASAPQSVMTMYHVMVWPPAPPPPDSGYLCHHWNLKWCTIEQFRPPCLSNWTLSWISTQTLILWSCTFWTWQLKQDQVVTLHSDDDVHISTFTEK